MARNLTNRFSLILFIVVGLLTLVLVYLGGQYYYNNQRQSIRLERHNELKAISQLKSNQLVQWQLERLSEASFFTTNPLYVDLAKGIKSGRMEDHLVLRDFLLRIMTNSRYQNIFMLSGDGELLFSVDTNFVLLDDLTIEASKEVVRWGEISVIDFYYSKTHQDVYFEIIAPIQDEYNDVFATLIFRVDPFDYLFPLLYQWPTPSISAESFIVRKDGDSVVHLNKPRHLDILPLDLRLPLSRQEVSSVQAVLGHEGMFDGYDYRGVRVLSDIMRVPDTPWYIVSEVDSSEVYADLNRRTILISSVLLLSVLLLALFMVWYYHYRQRNLYRKLYIKTNELHQSQEEFSATLYSIGDGVITTDRNGIVKRLNPVAETLTGWKEDDAKGRKIEEVFRILNEETRLPIENPVKRIISKGSVLDLANHILLIAKDGREIPIADSGAPIRDSKGTIIGVVLVFSDQTKVKTERDNLIQSEERFAHLFERAPLSYQSLDDNGCFIEVNEVWLETLGYSKEEVIGRWFGDFLSPLYRERFIKGFPKFKAAGRVETELEMICKDGRMVYIDFSGRVGYRSDGNFEKTHCILKDVTQQRVLEGKLLESERSYRDLINGMNETVWIIRFDGELIDVNERAVSLLGYTKDELLKIGLSGIDYKHDKEQIAVYIDSMSNDTMQTFETTHRAKDGTLIPVEINSTLVSYMGEKAILSIARDITERKRAQEQLHTHFSLLRIAGKAAKFGGWSVDLTTNRCIWSDTVAEIHEEPIGFSPLVSEAFKYYAPEWRDKITKVFTECAEHGTPFDEEMEIITAKGNRVWVRATAEAVKNKDGGIIRVQGAFHNISKIKKAYKDLEDSRSAMNRLISNLPGIAYRCSFGREWTMQFISKGCEKITGYADSEFYNSIKWSDIIIEQDREFVYDEVKRSIERDESFQIEYRIRDRNGGLRWVWEKGCGVTNGNGQVLVIEGFISDLTQRKQAEIALFESEEKFRSLVENLNEILYVLDTDARISYISPNVYNIGGYTPEEVIGKSFLDFVYPEDVDGRIEKLNRILSGEKIPTEYRFITKDGEVLWMRTNAKPVVKDGQNVGVQGVLTDITLRRQAEEALQKIEWMLTRTSLDEEHIVGADKVHSQSYGDLTELNQRGIIKSSIDREILHGIVSEYMTLLETSSAIYELNGDYAYGIFSSKWCQLMDQASRDLCGTNDNEEALRSGKWLCHESCWESCSKKIIETQQPVGIECDGGIKMYGVPIFADGEVIGAINFGYGDPPKGKAKLEELARLYNVDVKELIKESEAYDSRPAFIIEMAKKRVKVSANLIGVLVERKRAEDELRKSKEFIQTILENMPIGLAVNTVEPSVSFEYINDNFTKFYGISMDAITTPDTFWNAVYEDPEHREAMRQRVLSDMASGDLDKMRWSDIPIHRKGEEPRYISARNIPLPERNMIISTVWDVTLRKKAELELLKLKDELELKVQEKTKELQERIAELERFHEATINRELRMKELREEIKRLKGGGDRS